MRSNSKPKGAAKEAPTEPFKRAVGICLKAIAAKGDIEVNFASERPGLGCGKARLPARPRRLYQGRQQCVRSFGGVGEGRVEAIGACLLAGLSKNLTAMLDDRFHRGKFDEIT